MNRSSTLLTFILLAAHLGTFACGSVTPPGKPDQELTIFAAASLTDVLVEIAAAYPTAHGIHPVFNFAGSNVLAQQIMAAPGADIFVSASREWMDALEETGRIREGSRFEPWTNNLVVIGNASSGWRMRRASDLCGLEFRYLALGNPESVPAGQYAREWLRSQRCNGGTLWASLAGRISPAPDVRAVLAQVEANSKVIGIVYRTDYAVARDRVQLIHSISIQDGPPIRYAIAQLEGARNPRAAHAFLEFLRSPAAESILERHGFTILQGATEAGVGK